MSTTRRHIARNLSRSRREIPEATVWVDVDVTDLITLRADLSRSASGGVSVLALLARFCVAGLRHHPTSTRAFAPEEDVVLRYHDVNLGFAAQTPRGLVVPVVHGAEKLNVRELHARIGELTSAAREGVLSPARMTGGTFTINNYGVFGVDGAATIINYPEVAILGIGRIIDRPWVVDGAVMPRKVTELTLAFDHRACDGETAGGFLRYVADCMERPLTCLVDL